MLKIFILLSIIFVVLAKSNGQKSCSEEPDQGPCKARIPKWYYDAINGACFQFSYGGCKGNGNRFDNKDECLKFCKGK
uniref:U58-Eretoxin-Ek1b_1 n=1 Tax=Eresus cinnaberinus TaxID=175337 RepID=A0A2D0PDJ4_ERECI